MIKIGECILKKIKALILAMVLFFISAIVIIMNGKTYTFKIESRNLVSDIDEVVIEIDNEKIVKCINKSLEKDVLMIKLESISKGKTSIYVSNTSGDIIHSDFIYVHNFGIITVNEFMGNSNGSIVIPISITIWLVYVLYLLIISYKHSVKVNMYQYKNIVYLGVIIFVAFSIISQILVLSNYKGLINTINGMLNMFSFAVALLPIAFVIAILVIISNITLIRKEGFNFTNTLGLILGTLLCFATILPELLYRVLYSATWIDVHNQNGIGLYFYNLMESIIYVMITYIECILLGTIIMGIKAAKHIPQFDKDFIIILGCQIKKDGILTNLLKARVDRAIEFAKMQKEKTGKDIVFVPSGGKGNDEVIAEAQAMKNYLLEQGITEESILTESNSKNTFENIRFSNQLINEKIKDANVAFSTTNYHVFRAGCIANEQNLYMEGIGAKTKSYFWINAFIREFIATIFTEKKKHIIVIFGIILLVIFMIAITYLNNNL